MTDERCGKDPEYRTRHCVVAQSVSIPLPIVTKCFIGHRSHLLMISSQQQRHRAELFFLPSKLERFHGYRSTEVSMKLHYRWSPTKQVSITESEGEPGIMHLVTSYPTIRQSILGGSNHVPGFCW